MKIKKFFKPSNSAGKSQAGFTLIELLVVIGIIAVLATIGTISFGAASARARSAKRVADLRTIQSGLEIFNADQATYPSLGNTSGAPGAAVATWAALLISLDASNILPPRAGEQYCYYVDSATNPRRYALIATDYEGDEMPIGSLNTGAGVVPFAGPPAAVLNLTSNGGATCAGADGAAAPADPNCINTVGGQGNDYCIGAQ